MKSKRCCVRYSASPLAAGLPTTYVCASPHDGPADARLKDSRSSGPPALLHFRSEIFDRLDEALVELDLRLPTEKRAGTRDVGAALFGVVGGQRLVDDGARRAGPPGGRFRVLFCCSIARGCHFYTVVP